VIPERNVCGEIEPAAGENESDYAMRMVQYSVDTIMADCPDAKVLVLPDGPYLVPVYRGG